MILNFSDGRRHRCAETAEAVSAVVNEIFDGRSSKSAGNVAHGDDGTATDAIFELSWSDRCHDLQSSEAGRNGLPSNFLSVACNHSTGYGALVWCVDQVSFPRKGGIHASVWVTDNVEPPEFDTGVIMDQDVEECHDPRSTIPLHQVRQAVEEFCRLGTGDRPESVRWVEAFDFVGRRFPLVTDDGRHDPFLA